MAPKQEAKSPQVVDAPPATKDDSAFGISRRGFVQASSAVALTIAFATPGQSRMMPTAEAEEGSFDPSAWISIDMDGRVKFIVHRSEMGQGVRVALPMMLADELCVDLESVDIEQAVADTKYGNQNTDGSTSIRLNWDPLRKAGAAAREMLTAAAATKMGVPASECTVASGVVEHAASGQKTPYADVVADAAKLAEIGRAHV